MVKLHAPPGINMVTRGEAHEERHYIVNYDGTLDVFSDEVEDFLAMGFSHEKLRVEAPPPPTARVTAARPVRE